MKLKTLLEGSYSPEFEKMANKDLDHRTTLRILESWPTRKLRSYIANLTDEQYNDEEAHRRALSTIDRHALIEYLGRVIFGWGWEGTVIGKTGDVGVRGDIDGPGDVHIPVWAESNPMSIVCYPRPG